MARAGPGRSIQRCPCQSVTSDSTPSTCSKVTSEAGAPAASAAGVPSATQQAEIALAASMDAVAARWRMRAAQEGWPVYPPTPVAPLATIEAEARTGSAPSGQPQGRLTPEGAAAPKTSEKHGTAAPSPDAKPATKPPTQPSVKARAPDAVN